MYIYTYIYICIYIHVYIERLAQPCHQPSLFYKKIKSDAEGDSRLLRAQSAPKVQGRIRSFYAYRERTRLQLGLG